MTVISFTIMQFEFAFNGILSATVTRRSNSISLSTRRLRLLALRRGPSLRMASPPLGLHAKLDLDAIRALISSVSHHTHHLLSDAAARNSFHLKCSSRLPIPSHGQHFDLSDHSVLSSLYRGIDSLEAALRSDHPEQRSAHLSSAEKMLQVPALLGEEGDTAGVPNRYLVCCSYFYLSLVRRMQGDEWQMTVHFLHSVIVSPGCVRTELATPGLWGSVFSSVSEDEGARQQARRYKDWLLYYQVVSYGEAPPWSSNRCSAAAAAAGMESHDTLYISYASTKCLNSREEATSSPAIQDAKVVYPLDLQEYFREEKAKRETFLSNSQEQEITTEIKYENFVLTKVTDDFNPETKECSDIRCLQEMLEESQSDKSVPFYSHIDSKEGSDSEEKKCHIEYPKGILLAKEDASASLIRDRKNQAQCLHSQHKGTNEPVTHRYPVKVEAYEMNTRYLLSSRSHSSLDNLNFSVLDLRDVERHPISKYHVKDGRNLGRSASRDFRCFSSFSSKFLRGYTFSELIPRGRFGRKKWNNIEDWSEESSSYERDTQIELLGRFEKALSALCFSEGTGQYERADAEVSTIWEMLKERTEMKYSSVRLMILDQLLDLISTSKNDKIIRASVSTLLVLISEDKTVIEDIKRKDLNLYNLASALKRNVHEAAILIYLLKPPPSEIKSLELLPTLVEVACNSNTCKEGSVLLPVTPTSASIAMIEILVTAFDYVTNNMHLAAISSPQILGKLVDVAMNKDLEQGVALAAILVRCMRLNRNCRKFLSEVTPVDPFLHLLRSNDKRAKFAALEYFNELLRMPRSSAIHLLDQIRQQGSIGIMCTLLACIQQSKQEHQLLAANLLLQLDILEESSGRSVFREAAMEVLLESVESEENSSTQALSAFILSNLGGTYAWTGEPYTSAWFVRKAGLTSAQHRSMIKNVDWFDPCLQDRETDAWSVKTARLIIKFGTSVFNSLSKGIRSKIKSSSHDCLITIAWIGSELATRGPSNLRYSACEILLGEITRFLHPGSDLDERILACFCLYNYTSGKGKQKLMTFSEGLRESLRRLSGVTWMAEELLKVTDFFLPNKPRVSCVHTQILEVGSDDCGAATALIFYKGQLYAGYSDGSIKVWEIKGQSGILVWEIKEHTRPVTCFALFGSEDSLLSGSSDKTIRVWKMIERKLECIEVVDMKEPVHKLDTSGDKILVITQSYGLKVIHASRSIQTLCKNKRVRSLVLAQGRVYLGCGDSSVQEVDVVEDHKAEIRAPTRSLWIQHKPINSILAYKGWIYCAGATVEGSSIKEWRRSKHACISLTFGRGTSIQHMAVVEDFMYLNCSSSRSIIQIWLRGTQQKVGRLSGGSKITSLLTANDIVICGTETGLIKGWIPF